MDYCHLQHGSGAERVPLKHEAPDNWFEGRWRKVHVIVSRTWIVFLGERITVQIEGV